MPTTLLSMVDREYDINNMVRRVKTSLGDTLTTYLYFADGEKTAVTEGTGTGGTGVSGTVIGRRYIGPFIFCEQTVTGANTSSTLLSLESATPSGTEMMYINNPAYTASSTVSPYLTLVYHRDHLGSVRAITKTDGTILEQNDYYPFGLRTTRKQTYITLSQSLASSTAPRYLYNGKEKQEFIHNTGSLLNAAGSATYTSNYIDYGARFYNPVTLRWTTQDPLAEKYQRYSPYNYCVNSPINFVDPNGMIWEDPKDAENLKTQIDKRINQLNKNNNKLQAKIAKGGLSDKKLAKIQDRIAENEVKILFLNKSLVDIKNIEEAKEVFRLAGPSQSDGTHGVVRGCDGVINIEGSNNGLYLHEMRHVGQSMEVGELKFNEKGQLYNSGKTKESRIENEVEAYKVQYSYDGSYPIGAISLKDINAETLMNIKKEDGTSVYEQLRKKR